MQYTQFQWSTSRTLPQTTDLEIQEHVCLPRVSQEPHLRGPLTSWSTELTRLEVSSARANNPHTGLRKENENKAKEAQTIPFTSLCRDAKVPVVIPSQQSAGQGGKKLGHVRKVGGFHLPYLGFGQQEGQHGAGN